MDEIEYEDGEHYPLLCSACTMVRTFTFVGADFVAGSGGGNESWWDDHLRCETCYRSWRLHEEGAPAALLEDGRAPG